MEKRARTVIVTGGNRGIGKFIVQAFAEPGHHVLVGARHDAGIEKMGKNVRFLAMDVRKEEGHKTLVKYAMKWTGRLDVYINCAGFSKWSPVVEVGEKFWDEMMDTNLKGVFWGCKTAAKALKKDGCIINVSSLAGKRGSANNSVYCASKFGVNGLTQALAKELGPRGVRVNAVCPVYVKTGGLVEALKEKNSPAQGINVDEYLNKFAEENAALKRLPTGEEVAKVCWFLASADASAITGQCINVDCGVLPQ